jgi:phenylalanyl-tRNA synthetase alpha chain
MVKKQTKEKNLLVKIDALKEEAVKVLSEAKDDKGIEEIRVRFLGRKGEISQILQNMGKLSAKERPKVGQAINKIKNDLENELKNKREALLKKKQGPAQDITMPGFKTEMANLHPLTQTIEKISDIFISLGFKVVFGPEIETEYYNFTALNIPAEHPSRETFHTFFVDSPAQPTKAKQPKQEQFLLRSQTSPVQVRVMEKEKPPIKMIAPGKVFRPDATDASHSFMFHQLEGLVVDKGITFADLKGTLSLFAKRMFGEEVKTRFRPHYFPFTEPSAEMDISCFICQAKGCRVCSFKGWLEVLGAGMVHPNVFRAVKIDPEEYTGFAFGMGVERLTMLQYGITDIRLFFENDLRFLKQF